MEAANVTGFVSDHVNQVKNLSQLEFSVSVSVFNSGVTEALCGLWMLYGLAYTC